MEISLLHVQRRRLDPVLHSRNLISHLSPTSRFGLTLFRNHLFPRTYSFASISDSCLHLHGNDGRKRNGERRQPHRPGAAQTRIKTRPDHSATWDIVVVISLRDPRLAPHCAVCILFSFRFAIPHQRRCVRRCEGLHFASRYPTSPSAWRAEFCSARQNSVREAIFLGLFTNKRVPCCFAIFVSTVFFVGDRIRLVKLIFDVVEFF